MKILSCNIRCPSTSDGEDNWPFRKEICANVIRDQSPDIICFQELWAEQFFYLQSVFPEFECFGVVDEPCGRNPMNGIFYRAAAFARISAGGYWLSKTPHVPGSKSWDSDCIRLANWLRLEERASNKEFRVINTHLDHVSQSAREEQASLVVEDACAYPDDYAQILTGDMNCVAGNRAIDVLKAGGWHDTYARIHGTENPGNTYHAFLGPGFQPEIGKIDWIFAKGKVRVLGAAVVKDSQDGRFPSDHYFVSAEISINEE